MLVILVFSAVVAGLVSGSKLGLKPGMKCFFKRSC